MDSSPEVTPGHHEGFGQPPSVPQDLDTEYHRTKTETSPVNPSVHGATNSDELDYPMEENWILTPGMNTQSSGGPGSDQGLVPTCVKEPSSQEILFELQSARKTLEKYYPDRHKDPKIEKFYKDSEKDFKDYVAAKSRKASSSHAAAGTVKVSTVVMGKKTFGVDATLLKRLNSKELQVEKTDRQGSDVILIFCPIHTRVGSDVELAMKQVSDTQDVILILMHHTRDHEYSTAAKMWSDTYQNVVFNVSVLYHESVSGLLECPKNTTAIRELQDVLVQYSRRIWSSSGILKCSIL